VKKEYLLLLILLIVYCNNNKTESIPKAGQVGNQQYEITLKQTFDIEGLSYPIGLKTRDSFLYILEYDNSFLIIYNTITGTIKTIGREGSGPGEFSYPNSIELFDNSIVIANLNRKVCYFDYNGTLQKEFFIKIKDRQLIVLGGELTCYSDSLIILSDKSIVENYNGKLLHIFRSDWEYIRSCYDLSPICEKIKFFGMAMFSHEILNNGNILVMQPYEYSVLEMNLEGDTIHQTDISCSHYRPISKERYISSDNEKNDEKVRTQSDFISKFFSIDDSTLVISIMKHRDSDFDNYIDIVSLKEGEVVYTYKTNERLLYYDKEKQELYFHDDDNINPDMVSSVINVYSLKWKSDRP